jgi:hypothetical protein
MPEKLLQLVFALIRLVAFHVGRAMHVLRRCLRAGERELLSSSLVCFFPLRPHPRPPPQKSLPEVPGMSIFFGSAPRILQGAEPDRAVFFLFGLNCDIRREGSPRKANWEVFE